MIDGYKEWDLEEQFVVENHHQSMQLDSTDVTHPMTDPTVADKKQVSDMFDNISYNKASSIIRMISYILRGNDVDDTKFYEVLQHYLKEK